MKKQHHPWIQNLTFLVLGVIGGTLLSCHLLIAFAPDTIPHDAEPNFRLMAEAWNTIHRVYVDRNALKPQQMTYGAISGMVESLGDTGHSRFLSPEMVKQERNLAKGEIEGIGAEVQMKNGQLVIVAPIDGSPAQRAGLKPGEIIAPVKGRFLRTGPRLRRPPSLFLTCRSGNIATASGTAAACSIAVGAHRTRLKMKMGG